MNSERTLKEALSHIRELIRISQSGSIRLEAEEFLERMESAGIRETLVTAFCENCKVLHGDVEPLARAHGGAREEFEGLRPDQIIFFCAICKRARPFTPVDA